MTENLVKLDQTKKETHTLRECNELRFESSPKSYVQFSLQEKQVIFDFFVIFYVENDCKLCLFYKSK